MDTKRIEEDERMKKNKCRICGRKASYRLHNGMCFDCTLMIRMEIAKVCERTFDDQEKINEGLFQLIQLQQDIIDELVKHIDNEAITQAIATRHEIYEKCRGAAVRDAYRSWKGRL